jgi:hypothetical protein
VSWPVRAAEPTAPACPPGTGRPPASFQVTDLLIKFIFLVFAKIRNLLLLFIIGIIVDSESCLKKETRRVLDTESRLHLAYGESPTPRIVTESRLLRASLIRRVAYSAHW